MENKGSLKPHAVSALAAAAGGAVGAAVVETVVANKDAILGAVHAAGQAVETATRGSHDAAAAVGSAAAGHPLDAVLDHAAVALGGTPAHALDLEVDDEVLAQFVVVAADLDGNGQADLVTMAMDIDGDGGADFVGVTLDIDGDGEADLAVLELDIDGDGRPDIDVVGASFEDADGHQVTATLVDIHDQAGGHAGALLVDIDTSDLDLEEMGRSGLNGLLDGGLLDNLV